MQELDALDGPDIHVRQVAWIGIGDGPKYLYKRHRLIDPWTRASGDNRETEFATFQDLRRKGYTLVTKEGGPILDENGAVLGDKPLPPAKSTLSLEAIEAGLEQIKSLDMTAIPEGENPITRLLSLSDRMSLIRFNEALEELPRETLVGYALQVAVRVQGPAIQLTDGLVTPHWMHSCLSLGDADLLGHLVTRLATADKPELLALLKKLLPEVVRLEGLKETTATPSDIGGIDPHWRDGAA